MFVLFTSGYPSLLTPDQIQIRSTLREIDEKSPGGRQGWMHRARQRMSGSVYSSNVVNWTNRGRFPLHWAFAVEHVTDTPGLADGLNAYAAAIAQVALESRLGQENRLAGVLHPNDYDSVQIKARGGSGLD